MLSEFPQQDSQKVFQQGRSERGGEAYMVSYVEPLSDARTMLEDFFSILFNILAHLIRRRQWLGG